MLYGLGSESGTAFVNPPILWRSSPRGVDLLAFVHPNPNHPLVRWWLGDGQREAPVVFVEYTAALSLVALAVIAVASVWASFRPRLGWWWLTFGFMSLALGPFVIAAGSEYARAHAVGPAALPASRQRRAHAHAIRDRRRAGHRDPAGWCACRARQPLAAPAPRVGWPCCCWWLFELFPAPRTLYSGEYSPLSDLIAADPRPVRVLNLPFGVRDGVSSAGNFSARSQFEQTRHNKA